MARLARNDTSLLGRWVWSIDIPLLVMIGILATVGSVLIAFASTSVAARIGPNQLYFIERHLITLIPAVGVMIGLSFLNVTQIRLAALVVLVLGYVLVWMTVLFGAEINGAQRWLSVAGFSFQPTEVVKPGFAVFAAWLLSRGSDQAFLGAGGGRGWVTGRMAAVLLLPLVVAPVVLQPDLGMAVLLTGIWAAMLFVAGINWVVVIAMIGCGATALVGAYMFLPHVTSRVDRFLDPKSGDTYQIDRAHQALEAGGLIGRGIGEGRVKIYVPDSHADFIFAVAGEELGWIGGVLIISLCTVIMLRIIRHAANGGSAFETLALTGLGAQFALQTFINITSVLGLIPTKGMTLPFVSYGGSSLLGMGITVGLILALARRSAVDIERRRAARAAVEGVR